MSLKRFIYYNAVIGGWAALLAWLVWERPFRYMDSLGDTPAAKLIWNIIAVTLIAPVVGAAIGGGLNVVSGMTNPHWQRQLRRVVAGVLGGGIGGLIGGVLGALMYGLAGSPEGLADLAIRVVGWIIMGSAIGSAIGVAEGIYEQSAAKIRNGVIGGALGGSLGGLLFGLIARPGAEMSTRAAAFVILGVSIGAVISLTHVVLKEAWLTVVDGYGAGRQLILSQTETVLGRGDHLPLPFIGYAGRDLEAEHLRIRRQPDGQYVVEDNGSRVGTSVNGQRITGPVPLSSGDLIRLGGNIVRFEHRERVSERGEAGRARPSAGDASRIFPTPPPPKAPGPPPLPGTGPPRPRPQRSERTPPLPTPESPPPGTSPRIPPPPPPPA